MIKLAATAINFDENECMLNDEIKVITRLNMRCHFNVYLPLVYVCACVICGCRSSDDQSSSCNNEVRVINMRCHFNAHLPLICVCVCMRVSFIR